MKSTNYNFVKSFLKLSGIPYLERIVGKVNNIYVIGDGKYLFTAHHDVVNYTVDNILDNGSSVFILLQMIYNFHEKNKKMPFSVAFTDWEEFGQIGAKVLSEDIQSGLFFPRITGIINLELCSVGAQLWCDSKFYGGDTILPEIVKVSSESLKHVTTPPNDCYMFSEYKIPSVCVGLAPQEIWGECHGNLDTSLSFVDNTDIKNLLKKLIKLVKL